MITEIVLLLKKYQKTVEKKIRNIEKAGVQSWNFYNSVILKDEIPLLLTYEVLFLIHSPSSS